ncbi:putative sugar transferase EpsL [Planctomycetes bacterium CA13]|uniref:Putative sugar transferase EpsL n=1 Tax=Novipirellula herctigrandis TaxID=2527986 RepID=A0A5C5Z4Y5_9BACT|nr:putative sugar transferase EpsL [Planctomycetes bacterium CA13]
MILQEKERAILPVVALPIQRRPNPPWKRLFDLCGVAVLLPALSPLLMLVACYIKVVSRGPVFFVQSRVGHGGGDFRIIKFRTMHVPSVSRDARHRDFVAGYTQTDSQIRKPNYKADLIRGGNLLRKFSIDELPQLFNVLIGNMSLVGPRPDVLRIEDYQPWQLRRFEVLPGMTGLWQCSGKNRLTFDQMVHLDIEYIDSLALSQDLQIIAKTVRVVLCDHDD